MTMNIDFKEESLRDLYIGGATQDRKYRYLSNDIIKRYIKAVNYLRAVRRIEDLYYIKSLHYEKKKGGSKRSRCRVD